jgi:hypothetical protein
MKIVQGAAFCRYVGHIYTGIPRTLQPLTPAQDSTYLAKAIELLELLNPTVDTLSTTNTTAHNQWQYQARTLTMAATA